MSILKKLSQDYQSLLESSKCSDILIQVGEKSNKVSFKAHSLILRTRSPYFEELLSRYGNKGPKNVIFDKPNINPKLFKILLSYIYDGTVDLTELEFKEIIYLLWGAQVLYLEELCEYIENIIVVKPPDLINEHISLINRKGLSKFTKLTKLVRKFVYDNVEISFAIPMRQPNIQSNLIEQKHIVMIVKWINDISNLNRPISYTFNLLQRASKHGSISKNFHDRCDDQGATLLIIRVKDTGEILGGYNPIDWCKVTSKNYYHPTSESFIFSLNLQNLDNSIVSKVIDTKHAIKQYKYTGPTFGKNDLTICGESKENEKSRCKMHSYEKPIRDSTEFFCVDEYEVFQVFEKAIFWG